MGHGHCACERVPCPPFLTQAIVDEVKSQRRPRRRSDGVKGPPLESMSEVQSDGRSERFQMRQGSHSSTSGRQRRVAPSPCAALTYLNLPDFLTRGSTLSCYLGPILVVLLATPSVAS
ncbi:hypothetical protein XPA_009064 [Xanthoria parietina]